MSVSSRSETTFLPLSAAARAPAKERCFVDRRSVPKNAPGLAGAQVAAEAATRSAPRDILGPVRAVASSVPVCGAAVPFDSRLDARDAHQQSGDWHHRDFNTVAFCVSSTTARVNAPTNFTPPEASFILPMEAHARCLPSSSQFFALHAELAETSAALESVDQIALSLSTTSADNAASFFALASVLLRQFHPLHFFIPPIYLATICGDALFLAAQFINAAQTALFIVISTFDPFLVYITSAPRHSVGASSFSRGRILRCTLPLFVLAFCVVTSAVAPDCLSAGKDRVVCTDASATEGTELSFEKDGNLGTPSSALVPSSSSGAALSSSLSWSSAAIQQSLRDIVAVPSPTSFLDLPSDLTLLASPRLPRSPPGVKAIDLPPLSALTAAPSHSSARAPSEDKWVNDANSRTPSSRLLTSSPSSRLELIGRCCGALAPLCTVLTILYRRRWRCWSSSKKSSATPPTQSITNIASFSATCLTVILFAALFAAMVVLVNLHLIRPISPSSAPEALLGFPFCPLGSYADSRSSECIKCDREKNAIGLAISLLSFAFGAAYSFKEASTFHRLVKLRSITTFWQCAQLSSNISVKWPSVALVVFPFTLPLYHQRCLFGDILNPVTAFMGLVYIPMLFLVLLQKQVFDYEAAIFSHTGGQFLACIYFRKGRVLKREDVIRKRYEGIALFTILLWYSPLLQSISNVTACEHYGVEIGWRLKADPNVSCELGTGRIIVVIHALLCGVVVGLGLPFFILLKTIRKTTEDLNAYSSLSSVFEFYTPKAPYFESVYLFRKGLLILLASQVVIPQARSQAIACLCVNVAFFLALVIVKPHIYFFSPILPNVNLYGFAELSSALATVGDSVLALISAHLASSSVAESVGIFFVAFNIVFTVVLAITFTRVAEGGGRSAVMPETDLPPADSKLDRMNRRQSLRLEMGESSEKLEVEWHKLLLLLRSAAVENNQKAHASLVNQAIMLKSKYHIAVESLIKFDEGSLSLRTIAEFDSILSRMEEELSAAHSGKPRTCFDFALAVKNWELVYKILGEETSDLRATAAVSAAVDSMIDDKNDDQEEREKRDNTPHRMLFALSIILRQNALGLKLNQAAFLARNYVSRIDELQAACSQGGAMSLLAPQEWLEVVGKPRSEILSMFDCAFDGELVGLEAASDQLFRNCVDYKLILEQCRQDSMKKVQRQCRLWHSLALSMVKSSSSKKLSREYAIRLFSSCLLLREPVQRQDAVASLLRPDEFAVQPTIKDWYFERNSHTDDELSASSSTCETSVRLWALVEIVQDGGEEARNTKRTTGVINRYEASRTSSLQHVLLFERSVVPSFLEKFIDISIGEYARKLISNSFEVSRRRRHRRQNSGAIEINIFRASATIVLAIAGIVGVAIDAYAVSMFFLQGKHGFARALIATIMLCLVLQLILVVGNFRKRGAKKIAIECIYTIARIKNAVNTYRISKGQVERHEKDEIDPKAELACLKIIEVFCQIPCLVIQLYAALMSPVVFFSTFLSIGQYVFNVTATIVEVSYEIDMSSVGRDEEPNYYGLFSDSNAFLRSCQLSFLFLFNASQLTIWTVGLSLWACLSPLLMVCALSGELLIYYVVKMSRGDFYYSTLSTTFVLPFSLLQRPVAKVVCNSTGAIFTRHYREIGGIFWLYSVFFQHAQSFVAVFLYEREVTYILAGQNRTGLFFVIGILTVVCHVSFSLFLSTIPRSLDSTFFSTRTCSKACCANFLDAISPRKKISVPQPGDERESNVTENPGAPKCKVGLANDEGVDHRRAFQVFKYPRRQWRKIESTVREWMHENWSRFNENDDIGTFDWFTPNMAILVPLDMIPPPNEEGARQDTVKGAQLSCRRDDESNC